MTSKRKSTPGRRTRKTSPPAAKKRVHKTISCGTARPGKLCPQCRTGKLDYDGLLNLVCPICGYCAPGAGGFT